MARKVKKRDIRYSLLTQHVHCTLISFTLQKIVTSKFVAEHNRCLVWVGLAWRFANCFDLIESSLWPCVWQRKSLQITLLCNTSANINNHFLLKKPIKWKLKRICWDTDSPIVVQSSKRPWNANLVFWPFCPERISAEGHRQYHYISRPGHICHYVVYTDRWWIFYDAPCGDHTWCDVRESKRMVVWMCNKHQAVMTQKCSTIEPLQRVQNAAARLVFGLRSTVSRPHHSGAGAVTLVAGAVPH